MKDQMIKDLHWLEKYLAEWKKVDELELDIARDGLIHEYELWLNETDYKSWSAEEVYFSLLSIIQNGLFR